VNMLITTAACGLIVEIIIVIGWTRYPTVTSTFEFDSTISMAVQ